MSMVQLDKVMVLRSEGAVGRTNQNNLYDLFMIFYNADREDRLADYGVSRCLGLTDRSIFLWPYCEAEMTFQCGKDVFMAE